MRWSKFTYSDDFAKFEKLVMSLLKKDPNELEFNPRIIVGELITKEWSKVYTLPDVSLELHLPTIGETKFHIYAISEEYYCPWREKYINTIEYMHSYFWAGSIKIENWMNISDEIEKSNFSDLITNWLMESEEIKKTLKKISDKYSVEYFDEDTTLYSLMRGENFKDFIVRFRYDKPFESRFFYKD